MEKIDPVDRHAKQLASLHSNIRRKKNFFPGQRESENVELCIRTHWVREALVFGRFLLIGVIIPGGIFFAFSFIRAPDQFFDYAILILSVYLLFVWLFTFVEFLKAELTLVVVTNERIVDITQASLFDQQITETNLDRIQEVAGYTHGFMGTFLDLGKLEVQTAGSDVALIMNYVKSPQMTARKILDIQRMGQNRRRTNDMARRKDDEIVSRAGENFSAEEIKKMRGQDDSTKPERRNHSKV